MTDSVDPDQTAGADRGTTLDGSFKNDQNMLMWNGKGRQLCQLNKIS